jgi:hypothetical protein
MTEAIQLFTDEDIAELALAYKGCALWSSSMGDQGNLDDVACVDDIAPTLAKTMTDECRDFADATAQEIEKLMNKGHGFEQVGHDFWLTRNHHGAGFWDRGAGDVGKRLAEAARLCGARELYLGVDGKVYQDI